MSQYSNPFLTFEGSNYLRQRCVLSILSGRPLKVTQIRDADDAPGLTDYEVCFFKLIDEMSNGTKLDINRSGTELTFVPGMLQGGSISMDCDQGRALSYYLEPLLMLAPFCKRPLRATLSGVTDSPIDPSVDCLKFAWLPVMRKFLLNDEGLEIKITRRGFLPDGGGLVTLTCPICRQLRPVQLLSVGKVYRIRGTAFCSKVSASMMHRMIASARSVFHGMLSDVSIVTDQRKGDAGGKSPGFGLCLRADTTDGCVYVAHGMCEPRGAPVPSLPEDVGRYAATELAKQIYRGGVMDSSAQSLVGLFMSLGQPDVSQALFGPLSNYTVHMLRHLRDFVNVTFKIDTINESTAVNESEESLKRGSPNKAKLTCVGVGYSNLNKELL